MTTLSKPKVFISYAHEDRGFADLIRGYLIGRHDLGVSMDRDTTHGENWQEAMAGELDASDFVILLLSPAFLRSQWNLYEAGVALAKDRAHQGKVVPIIVGDIDLAALPAFLRRVATLDGRGADQRRVLGQLDEALTRAAA